MTSPVEDILFALLAETPAGKSVSPEAVARALDPEGWRRALPKVRATAIGLARQGRLVILRHGKPADPNGLKGVYRLALPQSDATQSDATQSDAAQSDAAQSDAAQSDAAKPDA